MLALGGLAIEVPRTAELTRKLWERLVDDARSFGDDLRAQFLETCGSLDVFFHERDPAVHLDTAGRHRVLQSLSKSEQAEFIALLTAMQEAEARFQGTQRSTS
jgi:hypothetical protein